MFIFQAVVSCVEAWGEFLNVATHPGQANQVGAPHDAASLRAQGVVEGPRRSTTAEADRRRAQLKQET